MKQRGINIVDWLISKNFGGKLKKDVDIPSWLLGKNSGGGGAETDFTENQAPTTWNVSGNSATGENEYGTWTIECDQTPANGNISNVFDGDSTTSTGWAARVTVNIILSLPSGVSIKPSKEHLAGSGNVLTYFAGYNEATGEWEQLTTGFPGSTYYAITTDNYFTKFKLNTSGLSSRTGAVIKELAVTEGTIKVQK